MKELNGVFEYEEDAEGSKYKVCQKAFLCILDMKQSKLRQKVTSVENRREAPTDKIVETKDNRDLKSGKGTNPVSFLDLRCSRRFQDFVLSRLENRILCRSERVLSKYV